MVEKTQDVLLMQREGNTSSRPAERGACWAHCSASAADRNRFSVFHLWFTPNTGERTRTWQNTSTKDRPARRPDWPVETTWVNVVDVCCSADHRSVKTSHFSRLQLKCSILISHLLQKELPNRWCTVFCMRTGCFFKEAWGHFHLCFYTWPAIFLTGSLTISILSVATEIWGFPYS